MQELEKMLKIMPYKIVLSNNREATQAIIKVVFTKSDGGYRQEKFSATQVFHETVALDNMKLRLADFIDSGFCQINAWSDIVEAMLKVSKKGKVLYNEKSHNNIAPKSVSQHNREKKYMIAEGSFVPPLVDMGVFTKEGKVVASMYDKFRQINRFIEIVDDEVKYLDVTKPIKIIDFGCGKSYLSFVLYHYFTAIKGLSVKMIGLDLKTDVIAKCNAAAQQYGYDGLTFEVGDIKGYGARDIDIVISLHACDIATDFALFNAIKWGAKMIFSVPCCQHELNGQIKSSRFATLTKYGIIKERMAALMTDALRAELLEYCGYNTQVLEFVDLSHTPKNLLLRAVRANVAKERRTTAKEAALSLCAEFSLEPMLLSLIKEWHGGKLK